MPSDQIDISKIKVGDKVGVEYTVTEITENHPGETVIRGQLSAGLVPLRIYPSDIISHTPKALEVGDRVRDNFGGEWEVIGPARERSDGRSEYPLWSNAVGHIGHISDDVESWGRLDAQ